MLTTMLNSCKKSSHLSRVPDTMPNSLNTRGPFSVKQSYSLLVKPRNGGTILLKTLPGTELAQKYQSHISCFFLQKYHIFDILKKFLIFSPNITWYISKKAATGSWLFFSKLFIYIYNHIFTLTYLTVEICKLTVDQNWQKINDLLSFIIFCSVMHK